MPIYAGKYAICAPCWKMRQHANHAAIAYSRKAVDMQASLPVWWARADAKAATDGRVRAWLLVTAAPSRSSPATNVARSPITGRTRHDRQNRDVASPCSRAARQHQRRTSAANSPPPLLLSISGIDKTDGWTDTRPLHDGYFIYWIRTECSTRVQIYNE